MLSITLKYLRLRLNAKYKKQKLKAIPNYSCKESSTIDVW